MNKISKNLVIILLIVAIVISAGLLIYNNIYQNQVSLFLLGNKEINIYENDIYKEPGFYAKNSNNDNLNNRVIVESNLNNKVVGSYKIKYSIKSGFNTITLERTVNVLKDSLKNIEFNLKGNKVINIELNEEYIDPLYSCIDKQTNRDLSSLVKITNLPDNQNVGVYEVKYTLNIDNKEKTLTRTVNVLDKLYEVIISNSNPTNQDITITFTSNITNFSHLITPDNKMITEKSYTHTVSENGQYIFTVYDDENGFKKHKIEISNIDKEPPIINSCTSVIDKNTTTFTINTSSNDISKYSINNITFTSTSYRINQKIENATLVIYDKLNNKSTFKCDSYYKEIVPRGNENIIKRGSTNTLKVWIEKSKHPGGSNFYITHIWALNPYNQFKSAVPNNFGKELVVAKNILDNAINQNGLQNKLIIAVNASGFVKAGTYGDNFYRANRAWNYTSCSPIVIVNGKILRNFATGTIPDRPYITCGLKRDGNFGCYGFKEGTNLKDNINSTANIINSGILNTFAFGPILVENYQKQNNNAEINRRQGLCQIDKNNFLLITDEGREGFSFSELSSYMISLGCKFGFNLDGGGSTSLIYKDKNGISTPITGNSRQIADIIYFHE